MKDKAVGKYVKFDKGGVFEYELRQSGAAELVGVRPLPKPAKDLPDLGTLKATDIIAFNSEAERVFVEILSVMCQAAGAAGVGVRIARAEIAFRLGVSTETVKRYIEKWTAPSAPFTMVDGKIFLKEEGNAPHVKKARAKNTRAQSKNTRAQAAGQEEGE